MGKESGVVVAPQELEQFIPADSVNGTKKYIIVPAKKDKPELEHGYPEDGEYDPFKARNTPHPVTDNETFTHLLKASLGTGILSMPVAFKYSGLGLGVLATILTAFVCTHCSYILVKCAHTLYKRTKTPTMTFAEVAEVSFAQGPAWGRGLATVSKYTVLTSLFITYFGTCSVYTVIIAKNVKQVLDFYSGGDINLRLLIAYLLIPLILLSWVPHLKHLAPFSMIANFFMAIGLGITLYYLVIGLPPIAERDYFNSVATLPPFIAITIFAMEAIGVVMPLENQMKTPKNFVGALGVLNRGMGCVTVVYMLLGFFGYWQYGEKTLDSITLNLPLGDIAAQAVKILVACAVYCTFGLQFYVCIEIGWNALKDTFTKRPNLVQYTMRTVMVTACVLLAVAVPTIGPFVGLIGAFCFSILGLMAPVLIETVTYWEEGFGKYKWIVWKNVLITIFATFALVFGSLDALGEIKKMYMPVAQQS